MNKFNVQDKIRLSFILVFIFMMLVTLFLYLQMSIIGEQTRLLYEHPYQVGNAIREIKFEIFLNQNRVENIRFVNNDRELDSIKAEMETNDKTIREDLKIVSQKFLGSKALVDSTFFAYAELKNMFDRFYQLKKENQTDSIQILLKSDARVKFDKTVFLLTNISDFAENKADITFNKVIETESKAKRKSIILIMLSGLIFIFFIWYLTRIIIRPIKTFISEANVLLKKDEKASVTFDEHIMVQTIAELKNAYLSIERQNHEIKLQKNQLAIFNLELEGKVKQRTSELSIANAELAIQYESAQHLASIVESSDDAIISKSLDGTIISWNAAAEKMFDYTSEEVIGENISLTVPPEYIHYEKTILDRIMKGEAIENYQTVRRKKSGKQFHVSVTVSSLKNNQGKITGISKIIRDITQRMQEEENLTTSEMRYRRLFESAKDGILILDAETGMIVDVNPFMIEMLGYSHKEYLGKSIWDVGHFKDIVANKENFLKLQRKEYIRYDDLPLETSGGQIVHVEFVSNVYQVNNQKVIQCNIRDISKRYRVEKILQKWNAQFKKLSSNAPGMMYQFSRRSDGSFYVPIATDGIKELYGCSPQDVTDDFSPIAKVIYPDDAEKMMAEIENSAENLTIFNFEYRVQQPGKAMKWLQSRSSPEKEEDGTISWYGFNTDITEKKQVEEKLKSTVQDLKLSNKDLEQFAYVANHDLQEPLRMISSYTQLLERKYKDKLDQDATDYIQFVVNGAIRMQKLLNDLLEFSKINSHAKMSEQVSMSTPLGQAISNLQSLIADNNALITNDDLPVITADDSQVMRLFQNLIGNAIKFKKKTELPKIHISCIRQKDMYQFSVADNGIGMEMQYHDRVFAIFQRLHSVKHYPGTGMGLSICKRIVERHGGTIWFESTVNEGTTFYFTIPE